MLTALHLEGFKAFRDPVDLVIRPLTLFAGTNSSGKSSAVQPLLLLKQTLEASYDPGPLLLLGPCVRVNEAKQLLWRAPKQSAKSWSIGLRSGDTVVTSRFGHSTREGVTLLETRYVTPYADCSVRAGAPEEELRELVLRIAAPQVRKLVQDSLAEEGVEFRAVRDRSHIGLQVLPRPGSTVGLFTQLFVGSDPFRRALRTDQILDLIHLPGLRGNPERAYPVSRAEGRYPGAFPPYTASVLLDWQERDDPRQRQVGEDLAALGVTWKVEARRLDDASVELRVARLPQARQGGAKDLVNVADVGFGASQVLPVLVALRAAKAGQVVHIEQPELHLHPNAQVAMAGVLLDAAKRGVRVLVETHSSVLLKAVQVAVAEGQADASLVALHWFRRDEEGVTRVTPGHLDEAGAYGDWPVDFADVELEIERRYIEAAFRRSSA